MLVAARGLFFIRARLSRKRLRWAKYRGQHYRASFWKNRATMLGKIRNFWENISQNTWISPTSYSGHGQWHVVASNWIRFVEASLKLDPVCWGQPLDPVCWGPRMCWREPRAHKTNRIVSCSMKSRFKRAPRIGIYPRISKNIQECPRISNNIQ